MWEQGEVVSLDRCGYRIHPTPPNTPFEQTMIAHTLNDSGLDMHDTELLRQIQLPHAKHLAISQTIAG